MSHIKLNEVIYIRLQALCNQKLLEVYNLLTWEKACYLPWWCSVRPVLKPYSFLSCFRGFTFDLNEWNACSVGLRSGDRCSLSRKFHGLVFKNASNLLSITDCCAWIKYKSCFTHWPPCSKITWRLKCTKSKIRLIWNGRNVKEFLLTKT